MLFFWHILNSKQMMKVKVNQIWKLSLATPLCWGKITIPQKILSIFIHNSEYLDQWLWYGLSMTISTSPDHSMQKIFQEICLQTLVFYLWQNFHQSLWVNFLWVWVDIILCMRHQNNSMQSQIDMAEDGCTVAVWLLQLFLW